MIKKACSPSTTGGNSKGGGDCNRCNTVQTEATKAAETTAQLEATKKAAAAQLGAAHLEAIAEEVEIAQEVAEAETLLEAADSRSSSTTGSPAQLELLRGTIPPGAMRFRPDG